MRLGLAIAVTGVMLAGVACGQEAPSTDAWAPRSATRPTAVAPTTAPEAAPEASPEDAPGSAPEPVDAPPLTEREPGCLSTIDSLAEPEAVAVVTDPMKAAMDGSLVPLPLPGHDHHRIVDQIVLRSVDEFFAVSPGIVAPEERRAAMEAAGFVAATDTTFAHDQDRYSVSMIRFASVEGARQYYDVHLPRTCRDAVNMRALERPVGAVMYTRVINGDQYPKAVALVGDVEISVSVCQCVGVADLQSLSADWMAAIVEQVTASGVAL